MDDFQNLNTRVKPLVVALALASAATFSSPAALATNEAKQIEEVVVTARRRDESLSDVPLAVSAMGREALTQRQVRTDSDLQLSVPGLTIRQTQGNNSLTYSIRGQTADTFSGSPTAVITYLNDVPLTVGSASSFFDLSAIQVLKGPQGTLFGRNATGGAVLYNTAKPTAGNEASLTTRVGNFDLVEVEGMVNVPLIEDTVLLRAAFNTIERDGYIENLLNGEELGELDRTSGRVSLSIAPGNGFENTTVAQYAKIKGTNTGASYTYSVYSCGETNNGVSLTCGAGFVFGPTMDLVYGPGSWNNYLAANPEAYAPGLIAYVAEQERMGLYKTRHPGEADHRGNDLIITNTSTYEINETLNIKNILGYSLAKTDSEQPQLGAPFVTILTANESAGQSGNEQEVESFSEEIQLQGIAFDGKLEYILGAYFQRQQTDTLWPQTYFDVRPVAAATYVTNNFRVKNATDAIFAQGTYDLSEASGITGLSATAGVRYTWEKVEIQQLEDATFTANAADQDESFEEPSWELGVEYQADTYLTYLKARGSFRSGGFNGAAPPVDRDATGGGNKFDSETVQDLEAGFKYRGSLFERPATLNVALYKQWVDDVQRVEFPDPDGLGGLASIAVTANVPEAVIQGIELETTLDVTDWLQLGLMATYTDAEFTNGDINLFGTNYSYGPVGDTPESSGVLFSQFNLPADESLGFISLRAEIYAQSSQYFSNAADSVAPRTKLPGYELFNARFDWDNILGSQFSGALFGKNLTDEEYFVGGMTLAAALGHNAAAVGEPRTYGLELSYTF